MKILHAKKRLTLLLDASLLGAARWILVRDFLLLLGQSVVQLQGAANTWKSLIEMGLSHHHK
jgi:hypothetical protein